MGSKGGGADAGPMIEYGKKALKLQKEMYDYSKEVSQPWLQTGTSAIGQLGTLMGLPGASGAKTRDQLYQELLPQYTSKTITQNKGSGGGMYSVLKTGQVFDPTNYVSMHKAGVYVTPEQFAKMTPAQRKQAGWGGGGGGGSTTTSSVDQAGLNAAIEAALASQTPSADFGKLLETYTGQDIYTDPSYQFRLGQGQKAMERQMAASGKYLTPQASAALMDLGQQMGSQEYQNAYNRFNQDQGNLYNRLANLAGMGQTQTGQIIGAGSNYANAATDLYTGMGNATVAAQQANQSPSMFNTLLGVGGSALGSYAGTEAGAAALTSLFSDERLKTNIEPVGVENGHNVYEFQYAHDPENKKYIGVIAQEVLKTNPEAVVEIDGYLAVNYDKIGVKFREADNAD
jgi:hypothetical protein